MLELLRERGELEPELSWPQRTLGTYLGWVVTAGAVEKLAKNHRRARYRLTS